MGIGNSSVFQPLSGENRQRTDDGHDVFVQVPFGCHDENHYLAQLFSRVGGVSTALNPIELGGQARPHWPGVLFRINHLLWCRIRCRAAGGAAPPVSLFPELSSFL